MPLTLHIVVWLIAYARAAQCLMVLISIQESA